MKKLLLTLVFPLAFGLLAAQPVIPPYDFQSAEDFTRCNDAVLECCNWLTSTPVNELGEDGFAVFIFIWEWSMGSPDVLIIIDDFCVPYIETTPDLLLWHMAGSAKYQLERGIYATGTEDVLNSTMAGIETVVDYYRANTEHLGRDKNIEKLGKLRDKGKLPAFLAKYIKEDIPDDGRFLEN